MATYYNNASGAAVTVTGDLAVTDDLTVTDTLTVPIVNGPSSLAVQSGGTTRLSVGSSGVSIANNNLLSLTGAISKELQISPTQLVANTDNWAPTNYTLCSAIRIDVSGAINLTGIVAVAGGRTIILHNISAFTVTLVHDATSTAANRFLCPGSANFSLTANRSVTIRYDDTSSRWRVIA